MDKYLLLVISVGNLISFTYGNEQCENDLKTNTSKFNENYFKNKLEYNKFYMEKSMNEEREKLFMKENEMRIHIETDEKKLLDKYFEGINEKEIINICQYKEYLLYTNKKENVKNNIYNGYIIHLKKSKYAIDMYNYFYNNKIIDVNYFKNDIKIKISNIIIHFLNVSDIKITDKIKSNLKLIDTIGSEFFQKGISFKEFMYYHNNNHQFNNSYMDIELYINRLNYCDYVYNISDILNVNDNNTENNSKRLKYWLKNAIINVAFLSILIIYFGFFIYIFYILT